MNIRHSNRFKAELRKLSAEIRKKFYRQARYLTQNITHPSLHAKKYRETDDIWQARIDRRYRFYFKIQGDIYTLFAIKRHAD